MNGSRNNIPLNMEQIMSHEYLSAGISSSALVPGDMTSLRSAVNSVIRELFVRYLATHIDISYRRPIGRYRIAKMLTYCLYSVARVR